MIGGRRQGIVVVVTVIGLHGALRGPIGLLDNAFRHDLFLSIDELSSRARRDGFAHAVRVVATTTIGSRRATAVKVACIVVVVVASLL